MNLPTTLGRATASTFQPRTPPPFHHPLVIPQTKLAYKFLNLNTSLSNTREPATKGVSVSLSQPSVTETCRRSVTGRCCSSGDESGAAAVRLQRLVMEFQLLTEPIDRVKRLLEYAATLPLCDDSARLDSNRVTGCTSQVWLEAGIDGCGRMKFRADSDSEITKGFCSCLIWVLDGAEPWEVLAVRAEDFAAMNVGLVAHSRVNTWHNVLIGMQKRTKALVKRLDPFSLTSSAGGGDDDLLLDGNQARVEIRTS